MNTRMLWAAAVTVAAGMAWGGSALSAADEKAADGPRARMEMATTQILDIVRDPAMKPAEKKEERRRRIQAIVNGVFQWEDMARSSLAVR